MERKTNPQRDPQQTVTKIGLAVVFLIGAALIFMGIRAQHDFASSGFSSESAYQAIYALTRDVSDAWKNKLEPELKQLSETDRSALDGTVRDLLTETWKSQSKSAELPADADEPAMAYKLLYTAYLVSGPKVAAGNRKAITAIPDNSASDFRQQLLTCVVDEGKSLPKEAEKLAEGLNKLEEGEQGIADDTQHRKPHSGLFQHRGRGFGKDLIHGTYLLRGE